VSIAPPEPESQSEVMAEPPPRRHLVEVLVSLAVGVVVVGLGAPLGWLWHVTAPRVELVQTDYGVYPVQPEPEGYIADDGWFLGFTVLAGIIVAVVAWFVFRRYRGWIMLLAITAGSIGGAVVAGQIGGHIGLTAYLNLAQHAPSGTHIFRPPRLRSGSWGLWWGFVPKFEGIVLAQGLIAAALYTAFAGFSYSPTLAPAGYVPPVEDPVEMPPMPEHAEGERPDAATQWGEAFGSGTDDEAAYRRP
jgi:hypothetical protein